MSKDYTYTEIMKMQEQAAERVREMKKRAQKTTEHAQRELTDKPVEENQPLKSYPLPPIPNNNAQRPHIPLNANITSEQIPPLSRPRRHFPKGEETCSECPYLPTQENARDIKKALKNLDGSDDKMILMALLFLLIDSGADETLVLAILYMMM